MADHPAAILGRQCAVAGLDLDAAQMVFRAVYYANALALADRSQSKAARIAEVDRQTIQRAVKPYGDSNG